MKLIHEQRYQSAQGHLRDCYLCPHRCGTARADAAGVCRVGQDSYIASEMLHMGEEELLRPAHAIFFSGCTATCRFCTAAKFAFQPTYGVVVSPAQMAARIELRQQQGARSLCFIGGDPAPHIPFVLATLAELGERRSIPAVFNSNFYLTTEALDLLDGMIDIYLPDLKFGPGSCGERLGGMPNYWQVVTGCIERILEAGERVIVRHLLMPGHLHCCTAPALQWLAQYSGDAYRLEVSLLSQYVAPAHARGELAATLVASDVQQAMTWAHDLNLQLVQ